MSIAVGISSVPVSQHRGQLRLWVAIALVLAMALPVRIWVPVGEFKSFAPIDVLLLASPLLLLACQARSAHWSVGPRSIALILLIPFLASMLSLLWSVDQPATIRASVLYGEAVVAYVFSVVILSRLSVRTIANLIALFVTVVIVTSVLSVLRMPGFGPQVPADLSSAAASAYQLSYYARLSNPYIGLSNNLATVLAFFPFVLAACAKVSGRAWYRRLAVVSVAVVCATLSRGVVAALAVAYAVSVAVNARRAGKKAWRISVYLLVIAVMFAGYVAVNNVVNQYLPDRLSMRTVAPRLEAQAAALDALSARPAGYGAGVDLSTVVGGDMRNTHNAYVQQLFYFGLVLGALSDLAIVLLPVAVRRWKRHSREARTLARGLGYALGTVLLVFVTEASYEGSVLRVLFYFSVACGVALVVAAEREADIKLGSTE
jgi:hypothetical protein